MLTRTIRSITVKAVAIAYKDGQLVSTDLEPIVYTGRKKTEGALIKSFKEQVGEGVQVMITSQEESEKTYQCTLEDFLKVAVEVQAEISE